MASAGRRSTTSLTERLVDAPESFDFVQIGRLLESLGAIGAPLLVGRGAEAQRTGPVGARFVGDVRMRYPNATVTNARFDGSVYTLTVSGFGLIGSIGTLPYSYTVLVADALYHKNDALKAFVDMFQHRATELFYGASTKYRIVVAHEREQRGYPNRFSSALKSVAGLGFATLQRRLCISDDTVLFFSGLFGAFNRTISGLEAVLASELDAPVSVSPLVGRWLSIDESEQTRLGGRREGQHARLGTSALVGARTWSVQNSFRIVVGPIDERQIEPLLPGGPEANKVIDIVRLYCGLEFEFDLRLIIRAPSVPAARLSTAAESFIGGRLGQTTWALAGRSLVDRDDAVVNLERASTAFDDGAML